MNKKLLIIIACVAVVFFIFGFLVSVQVNKPKGKLSVLKGQNTFEAGWEAAKKRLTETGFVPMMATMEVKTLSGEVKEIKGDKISLKIRPLEPLANPELDIRTIIVDDNTKLYQLEPKEQEVYQEEIEEYNRKIQAIQPGAQTQPLIPPEYFIKKQIKLADLKTGQQITVSADKDIKDVKEFKAKEITAQITFAAPPIAAPPAAAPPPATPPPATLP